MACDPVSAIVGSDAVASEAADGVRADRSLLLHSDAIRLDAIVRHEGAVACVDLLVALVDCGTTQEDAAEGSGV